jgi:hypothetical protein
MARTRNRQRRLHDRIPLWIEYLEDRRAPGTMLAMAGVPLAELSYAQLPFDFPFQFGIGLLEEAQLVPLSHGEFANRSDTGFVAFAGVADLIQPADIQQTETVTAWSTSAADSWQADPGFDSVETAFTADPLSDLTAFSDEPPRTSSSDFPELDASRAVSARPDGGWDFAGPSSEGQATTPIRPTARASHDEETELMQQLQLSAAVVRMPPAGGIADTPPPQCPKADALIVDAYANYDTATKVSTSATLTNGSTYTLIAAGDILNGNKRSDAEYYDFNSPSNFYQGQDVGIKLTGVTPGNPVWGSVYQHEHTYYITVIGQGQQLGAYYHDQDRTDNSGKLTVEVYQGDCPSPDIADV